MGAKPASRVALMSLHPQYAKRILLGSKKVEFRKRRLAEDVEIVLIYATAPVQRVVGMFSIKSTIEGTPEEIWLQAGEVGGIAHADYEAYYRASAKAVALLVKNPKVFVRPLPLRDISPTLVPPQSFNYLPIETLNDFPSAYSLGKPREKYRQLDLLACLPWNDEAPAQPEPVAA